MESLPERPKAVISKAWNSLDETLAEVQRLSQINQQVVRRGQRQIDDLVSILQGKGRTNKIYNQQGASGHVNPQSTIGKA